MDTAQQLQLAMQGDSIAFGFVAAKYRDALLVWCRGAVGETDAEDVAQETLLLAFQKLPTLREPKAFSGWLRQLVRTAAGRHYRKRQPDLLEDGQDFEAPEEVDRLDVLAEVRGAVRELSEYQKQAVEQHYLQGLSIKEIAARLSVPQGTIKRRLFDAREKLRIRLAGFGSAANDATDIWRG